MTDDTHKLTVGPPLRVAAPPRGTGSAVNASMNRKGWISKGALDRIRGNSDRSASSIGTLYQYFPGKEALLYALVGRHLDKASDAVERACQAHRTMPVATCSDAFVNAYIDAKTGNPASYRARCTMPRPSSS